MTTRNLDALFAPRAIALIGASNAPGSVGQVLARNLLSAGFAGPILPVNPHEPAIRSSMAYRSVADLPMVPDLAVIATPPATVPGLIAELAGRGCRAAVVITAGLDAAMRQAMLDAARPSLLRIVGPNVLGFISPARGINASFAHLTPAAGGLALVAQSGAVAAAALDWAHARGVGFSHVVTIGDAADVDFGDLLDHLALDTETTAILLYVESIRDARKFMTAGRIAARAKPVVVIKAGRSAAGAKAAFSHTGALAGADAVYDAAFRRAGMLRVGELRELFDAVTTLSAGLKVQGDRLAILTNGGGAGVMAADALEARTGRLASLSPATLAAIDKAAPANWSHGDPVDIIGDARPALYSAALEALLQDDGADAILVMNCPTAVTDSTLAAQAVIETRARQGSGAPILTCWMGETAVAEGRRRLAAAKIPTHETPDEAVRAFMHLVEYRRNQDLLLRTPSLPPCPADPAAARAIVARALAAGATSLGDTDARAVLKAYGVPAVESRMAATPQEAAEAAAAIGGEVALKILSPDISHKTDVGGVALGLTAATAATAAEAMLVQVRAKAPKARLDGFIVEQMVIRPGAQELLVGIVRDPTFGPVVLFGHGGVATEVIGDRTLGLTPLDDVLARDMIGRTRVARLLAGYRGRPPADLDAIADVLVRLARLATDIPEIHELDINPLLADADGVIALDARVRIGPPLATAPGSAIRPYPDDLVTTRQLGRETLTVRPIRPQDAPGLIAMVEASTEEDVRLRFGTGLRRLPDLWAGRLSQIDYDREMALVAERGDGVLLSVARLAADPEGDSAEFALMVRSDMSDHGLGRMMLSALLDYGKARGLRQVWGSVASVNTRMLDMAREFGFERQACEDVSRVRVVKDLTPGA
jgi:acetyltransferase